MTNGGAGEGEGPGWVRGGRVWGGGGGQRRKGEGSGRADQAAGDLWTEHSVIALDPFVFKWSHRRRGGDGGGGGGGGGGSTAQDALQ